jgi:hypothetical protein
MDVGLVYARFERAKRPLPRAFDWNGPSEEGGSRFREKDRIEMRISNRFILCLDCNYKAIFGGLHG